MRALSENSVGKVRERRGFSLIELLVVIGIIAILLGIALPSLGGAIASARLARTSATVKQNAALLHMYAADHREAFPMTAPLTDQAAHTWYRALMGSYITSPSEVDPVGVRNFGKVLILMSKCMVSDPALMRPGFTRPPDQTPSVLVRHYQVTYPDRKGVLANMWLDPTPSSPVAFCCAGPLIVVPVAMTEGSVMTGTRREFIGGNPAVVVDEIGIPVYSTWGGFLARDR